MDGERAGVWNAALGHGLLEVDVERRNANAALAPASHAKVSSTQLYPKDTKIFGEAEPADYIYQVLKARFGATSCYLRSARFIA